ncbi:MAG: hypothetical protein Sv326_1294 [Candidatus Fermentimicrarchaeum limneticum]|uniref:Uncharacterized protein n=1 Tax=Fermentimicrarchaeum limneticum TaxID=2795018 RepID=A0A7D5XKR4_FERL1|nr:MAG: hypothetical protein Sv326_1294 [Candidatus Fermentimicrarchaeum limneticum]
MEKKQNFLFTLRAVLSILMFLVLICDVIYGLFLYQPDCFPCSRNLNLLDPQVILPVLAIIIFLIIFIISIKLHNFAGYGIGFFITSLLLLILFILIPAGRLGCLIPAICNFKTTPTGTLFCMSDGLQPQTSKLYLRLSNGLDHNITINGIQCIKLDSWDNLPLAPSYIEPLNHSIQIGPRSVATVAGFGNSYSNSSNTVICNNRDGSMPSDTSYGAPACLHLYINYTDTTTGGSYVAPGEIYIRYYG